MKIRTVAAYEVNGELYKTKEEAEKTLKKHQIDFLLDLFDDYGNAANRLQMLINAFIKYGYTNKEKLIELKNELDGMKFDI